MKLNHALLALAISVSGTAFASEKDHDTKPMHGGVVAQSKDIDYELVASADKLQLHVRDHGKPMDVAGMTAKVTLLAGTDKQEVELKPSGAVLEAAGSFKVGAGTKVVAAVSKAGKSVASVRYTLK